MRKNNRLKNSLEQTAQSLGIAPPLDVARNHLLGILQRPQPDFQIRGENRANESTPPNKCVSELMDNQRTFHLRCNCPRTGG